MELPKKFGNRPNGRIRLKYNFNDNIELDYFISRATALVGVVFAITGDGIINILISKRSEKMRDEPGKVGIPCGYLDFDETCFEGMMREIYEETSLYLPDYNKYLLFNNNEQAFKIKDKPKEDKRQNVSHIYLSVYDFSGENADKFPADVAKFTCKETAWVKWISMTEFFSTYMNYEWAFQHDETIKLALEFFNKNRIK
jgi:8-oxo-dGTP pyrophosphatase MutT (NUDIX family)